MSAEQEQELKCKKTDSDKEEDMQTVVSTYLLASNLIDQADTRLIDIKNGFQNNSSYVCRYTEVIDELGPDAEDEKINVDEEDKEEELVIADDENYRRQESQTHNIHSATTSSCQFLHESDQDKQQLGNGLNATSIQKDELHEPTWHPHVYGKPPKKPTPHNIEYILGISKLNVERSQSSNESSRSTVSQLINVKRNFDLRKPLPYQAKSIHVQTDLPERKCNISSHKNKLQEQLLQRGIRSTDSYCDRKVQHAAKIEDQPLNLSVPKPKDVSSWSNTSDEDKTFKGRLLYSDFSLVFTILKSYHSVESLFLTRTKVFSGIVLAMRIFISLNNVCNFLLL